jgi:hypothetical protein
LIVVLMAVPKSSCSPPLIVVLVAVPPIPMSCAPLPMVVMVVLMVVSSTLCSPPLLIVVPMAAAPLLTI